MDEPCSMNTQNARQTLMHTHTSSSANSCSTSFMFYIPPDSKQSPFRHFTTYSSCSFDHSTISNRCLATVIVTVLTTKICFSNAICRQTALEKQPLVLCARLRKCEFSKGTSKLNASTNFITERRCRNNAIIRTAPFHFRWDEHRLG